MARALRASFVLATLGALECGLFPSLDGLSSGEPDASPTSDAATADAPGADAADGGRWCDSLSPKPMFCDDFDDQGPLTRWTDQFVREDASVGRDPSAFTSSPNALLALSPAAQNPSSAVVYLETADTKSKVHVAYDMRIDARDPSVGYAEINYIRFDLSTVPFAIYLRVYDGTSSTSTLTSEAYLADGGIPAHDVPLSGSPRFDAWTRVAVDLDLASTPHTLSITVDGQPAGSQTLEPDLYSPGPVRVNLGIGYTGYPTTGAWSIRYDNATIDWQ